MWLIKNKCLYGTASFSVVTLMINCALKTVRSCYCSKAKWHLSTTGSLETAENSAQKNNLHTHSEQTLNRPHFNFATKFESMQNPRLICLIHKTLRLSDPRIHLTHCLQMQNLQVPVSGYEPCSNSWYPSAPVKITSTQILMASGLGAIRWYILSLVFTTNVIWGFGDFTEFRWST